MEALLNADEPSGGIKAYKFIVSAWKGTVTYLYVDTPLAKILSSVHVPVISFDELCLQLLSL